jgi:acyl carrier protein
MAQLNDIEVDLTRQAEQLVGRSLAATQTWRDAGIDSLDQLQIVIRAEELFGVAVPDEVLANLHCIAELAAWVGSASGASPAAARVA